MVKITDFGASTEHSHEINTAAINDLITKISQEGGGRIEVPAGKFKVTSLELKSNIEFYISPGATLFFETNSFDYPVVNARWEGVDREVHRSLLYAEHAENISVIGTGTIEGNGHDWWKVFREKAPELKYPRPTTICFNQCDKVKIEGITIKNSPSWTVHPLKSNNVSVNGVSIINPNNSPNTDGINPESCKNVRISNCYIDVGDDCIAIKAGTEGASQRIPCENITIENCNMLHGHGGIVIGSEMSGDVKNVVVSNCVFNQTDRGIRLKTRRGRGGTIKNIIFNNIIMDGVMCPIVMNLYYFCGPGGKEKYVWDKNPYPVTEETPSIQNITVSNVKAINATAAAGFIYGLPESLIENIQFSNVEITMMTDGTPDFPAMMTDLPKMSQVGFWVGNAKHIDLSGVNLINVKGEVYQLFDTEKVSLPVQ
ncbi:glycoside hydrolase family 28 protein [Aerococcaceae bacterium zg-BR22]|uniref:glycoside hydrolase family 28 protein n=1 Tax=Aerococcaceae bacterium zg-1292 TaxID=2774330 RepID=UPI0040648DC5|nr:glycoside hydrolase family 28 protein [Aerococcaceae bacterium zg-BR22]